MITYAQNFEDVLLARAFAGVRRGFYIDIGAWDPVNDSVTRHFYDLGWHGINVEPSPEPFELLARERSRDLNLQVAVGARSGSATFYRIAHSGLSTLVPERARELGALGYELEEVSCRVTTLREICERHVSGGVEFLKIDVEGGERDVIDGADWARFRPKVVLVEAVTARTRAPRESTGPVPAKELGLVDRGSTWEPTLAAAGYELCYFDGLNRFYVATEERHLRRAFELPPNVWDDFTPYPLHRARAENRALREDLDRLKARCEDVARQREDLLPARRPPP